MKDFSRRKRKVSTSKSQGSSPRGFSPKTATGTSSQRRDQKNIKDKENQQTSPSKESEVPSQKKIEVKFDDSEDEIHQVEEVEESEGQIMDANDSGRLPQAVPDISQFANNGVGSKVVNNDIKSSEVKRVTGDDALDVLDRMKLGEMPLSDDKAEYLKENESLELNNFQETAIAETVLETDALIEIDSEEVQVDIIRSDEVQDEDNEENLSQKVLSTVSDALDAAVGTVEGDRQLETMETIVAGEIESGDSDDGTGEDHFQEPESVEAGNKMVSGKKEEEDYSLKLKLEMEANLRRQAIERLAEENFLQGNKLFCYPEEVKPDEDVEIFLNRSMSTLMNEPDVMIMGGFNDWRWRSFNMNLSKTNLNRDWWSCRLHVPKEAYKIDFVFFNGKDVYDNNNMKDFSITVKDGMDAFEFENFLLEEKQRELEKIAKEQAQREREAEEKRRIEAEKVASEADRAQAREEVVKTQKILQAAIDKASKSDADNWYIEPKEFKSEDKIRLYYNNSSGPLSHAMEIWIHGGHNNWRHGLSIVAQLSKSESKGGGWWYADGVYINLLNFQCVYVYELLLE